MSMKPPPDAVPPTPPTREQILKWNDLAGGEIARFTVPGEVITDPDGTPVGVAPNETYTVPSGTLRVFRDQLEAVGLTPDDVPNLHVVERRTT